MLDEVLDYLSVAPIKVVTLAPEISGHPRIIAELTARGVRVQIGHTLGSYDEGVLERRSSTARPVSRICSMRCPGCTTASPAWSARRSRMRTTPS